MVNMPGTGGYGLAPLPGEAEFADRIQRLQTAMAESKIDAVVLTSRENFEYFSSYRTMAWTYNARPVLLVVGRREVVLVAPEIERKAVSSPGLVCDARFYLGSLPDAAEAAVEACRGLASGPARFGVDYGHEFAGRGSLHLVEGLARQGTVIEAGDVIWQVRLVKSEFELGLLRATFAIANEAFDRVLDTVKVGMTEVEMCRALQIEFVKGGADRVDPFSVLFGRNNFSYGRPSSNKALQLDDYIWTDFRCSYGGYPADRNRTARVGTPSEREREAYATVRQVTIDVCEGIRPGMTGHEVYGLFMDLWAGTGLPPVMSTAGRIGHGGGIGLTEPPSLGGNSSEMITAGMVLHVEPKYEPGHGVFQCEEVVHIGPEGNEFLCELSPKELSVIDS